MAQYGKVETFEVTEDNPFHYDVPGMGDSPRDDVKLLNGWYWWSCHPGCLPDSDPRGPFDTEQDALLDVPFDVEEYTVWDGMRFHSPLFRLVCGEDGQWVTVAMLRDGSIFAHTVFKGTLLECTDFIGDLGRLFRCY